MDDDAYNPKPTPLTLAELHSILRIDKGVVLLNLKLYRAFLKPTTPWNEPMEIPIDKASKWLTANRDDSKHMDMVYFENANLKNIEDMAGWMKVEHRKTCNAIACISKTISALKECSPEYQQTRPIKEILSALENELSRLQASV